MITATIKKCSDERGFTLPELMITIVLLGILAAIAIPSWFGMIESRNLESASNQVAADLRLAHSRAANQLTPWTLNIVNSGDSCYSLIKGSAPLQKACLPDGIEFSTPASVVFSPSGTASGLPSPLSVTVKATRSNNEKIISVNTSTSRVSVED